jgi:predicted transcriptional regulator
MTVLLSIKPEYAERIFDGSKRFEFRRAIFKQPVKRVVVYASSPERRVIGEFEVEDVIHDYVESLWRCTEHAAGISEDCFFGYFADRNKGYAIKIGATTRYEEPRPLHLVYACQAPQSFVYVELPVQSKRPARFEVAKTGCVNKS